MTDNGVPGIPPVVAFMLVGALLCLMVLILIVASFGSRSFQRMQDRRFQQAPSRTEWLRVSASIWVRSIVDTFRRGH